jgi:hypothetical protein
VAPRRGFLSRGLAAITLTLVSLGACPASADPSAPLEAWLPPAMSAAAFRRALDDDLGSGLAGSAPLAVLTAAVELDPSRFGPELASAYRRYGFVYLKGRPRVPVGLLERRTLGARFHQFNCLACHSGPDPSSDRLIIGAINPRLDFSGWFSDVFASLGAHAERAASGVDLDELGARLRLTRSLSLELVAAARRGLAKLGAPPPGLAERALLAQLSQQLLAALRRPDPRQELRRRHRYGPGRTVVQAAYRSLRFDLDPGPFAPVKAPDLFGVRWRTSLLWTGNETFDPSWSAAERIARNGMLVSWIQLHPVTKKPPPDALTLLRIERYRSMGRLLAKARPPAAPAPVGAATIERYERGRRLFEQTCSDCHGRYRAIPETTPDGRAGLRAEPRSYRERLIPLAEIGVDPSYSSNDRQDFLEAYRATLFGRFGLFEGRRTGAFVPRPLLGLRFRAPYLHNASVPNLRALLTAPEGRPKRFTVGAASRWDPAAIGFSASSSDEAPSRDTTRAGNRATGHPYGTELSSEEKAALLEYLKRL